MKQHMEKVKGDDDYEVHNASEFAAVVARRGDTAARYTVVETRKTRLSHTQGHGRRGCVLCKAVLRVAKRNKYDRIILRYYRASRVPDAVAVVVNDDDLKTLSGVVNVESE